MIEQYIKNFIDYQYKEFGLKQVISACVFQFIVSFLIIYFHSKKSILFYLPLLISVFALTIFVTGCKRLNAKNRTFLFKGCSYEIFCIMSFLFIAGFVEKYAIFFVTEVLLLILTNIIAFALGCHSIRKNAFDNKAKKSSATIWISSIAGVVLGRFIFAILDIPNSTMLFLISCLILLFSFGGSNLLRLYLNLCLQQGELNKFIKWLEK